MKEERIIQTIKTKTGNETISVNNKLLHSKYDPVKEAKVFADKVKDIYENKHEIVIYGLGLGYHIKEILDMANKKAKLYIFDADNEVVSIALENQFCKNVLEDSRVEMYFGYDNKFLIKFQEKLNLVNNIIIFKPSLNVLPERLDDFKKIIMGYELGKISIERFGALLSENIKLNLNIRYNRIEEFFEKYKFKDKPVLIVSSGPSLDYCFLDIKKLRDEFFVISAGSALKPLINNGIKPDMFCLLDSQEIVYNQIKGVEDLDIPLCFLNSASHKAVSSYKGEKYLFYNEKKEDNIVIETGKSVATALLSIAIKGGAKTIVFVGQDLAYLNNKEHTEFSKDVYYSGYENKAVNKGNYKKVIGVDGSILDTTEGLLYFKNWIERKIKENPQITFINCSKGAVMKGTSSMDLKEAYESYKVNYFAEK